MMKNNRGSVSVDAQVSVHEIRNAIADYMRSEGCSCCRDIAEHEINTKRIAELLNVPIYDDSSGYDFPRFRSQDINRSTKVEYKQKGN